MTDDHETAAEKPADQPSGASGRFRLWRGLAGRPARGQVVVAVLLALLGFAGAVQIRATRATEDFAGQRRADLVELLDSLSGATDRAEQQIDDLRSTRADLQSGSDRRAAAIKEGKDRLSVLGILAGTVAAVGPGVTVTIHDPSSSVTAPSILNGIEELRDAGAEAIQVNQKVRVVASTSFTDQSGVLTVDGVEVRPPYVIDAIGSAHTLSEAVVFPGGLSDEIKSLGGSVSVKERDRVEVVALHTLRPSEYAHPTDR
ncbi:MAG: DUF881 domain-containing protein [Nocardioidaceae bacterium]